MAGLWQEAKSWFHRQLEPPMSCINRLLIILAIMLFILDVLFPDQQGMFQNLVAEVFGVWLAVVLIGEILRRDREKRELLARYVAFQEASQIYGGIARLWAEMAKHAIEQHSSLFEIKSDNPVFSREVANVLATLNLDENAPVLPQMSWREQLQMRASTIQASIDRALGRHTTTLKPEITALLRKVEQSDFLIYLAHLTSISLMRQQAGAEYYLFLSWGNNNSGDHFIGVMNRFGEQLAETFSEYKDIHSQTDTFDPYQPLLSNEVFKGFNIGQTSACEETGDD